MITRQKITSIGETPTFWNAMKPAVSGIHAYFSLRGPTLSFAPNRFDRRFVEDRKGKCRSFFFSPLSRITHSPSFFSSFPSLLFLYVFLFFSFFFSISFFLILPSLIFFFWLDLRKFPPSFSSLSHGHVSSHGPSIMCHMSPCEPCDTWTHALGGTFHTTWLSCHVSFSHGAMGQSLVMPCGNLPCVTRHPMP